MDSDNSVTVSALKLSWEMGKVTNLKKLEKKNKEKRRKIKLIRIKFVKQKMNKQLRQLKPSLVLW